MLASEFINNMYDMIAKHGDKEIVFVCEGKSRVINNIVLCDGFGDRRVDKSINTSFRLIPRKINKSPRLRKEVLDRDGADCYYCGMYLKEDERTLEHLTPLSRGGDNSLPNLALACNSCNGAVGSRDIEDKIIYKEKYGVYDLTGEHAIGKMFLK